VALHSKRGEQHERYCGNTVAEDAAPTSDGCRKDSEDDEFRIPRIGKTGGVHPEAEQRKKEADEYESSPTGPCCDPKRCSNDSKIDEKCANEKPDRRRATYSVGERKDIEK
jgi:hypothetical protein